ncbi:recombination mediator RecR [Bacteroidetes bacterium endosymbiont of Geopemphigus sp.]|uniref:recombination mediator RecR n=1 Tax=Bacteroidetes bacterium endosymbiont of Geopemphigus sp. TaxID=2047937 RepID=UPI000CCFF04B|nr:recombination mediator RecR [Bacteroidetes bacterium endosymbiont of Geopemphigus sp.]
MNYPSKLLEKAVYEMGRLPGIGKRTALRVVMHLLQHPKEKTKSLTLSLEELIEKIHHCKECHNISDKTICEVCASLHRDKQIICVVEDIRDVMAIENTGQYKGVYHVLGGKISPMEGIGPNQLHIQSLFEKTQEEKIKEIIFALSSTMEGDTTVFYIYKQIKHLGLKISTIARGISVGDELEYADEVTLGRSILHRVPYEDILEDKR